MPLLLLIAPVVGMQLAGGVCIRPMGAVSVLFEQYIKCGLCTFCSVYYHCCLVHHDAATLTVQLFACQQSSQSVLHARIVSGNCLIVCLIISARPCW